MTYDVPPELLEMVNKWRDWLLDHTWDVRISVCPAPSGDEDNGAATLNRALYRRSFIEFNTEFPEWDDSDQNVNVAHEILHVAHASVDYVVRSAIIPQLPSDSARAVALEAYKAAMEQFVSQVAQTLAHKEAELRQGQGDTTALRARVEALYRGDPYQPTGCGASFEEILCHDIHGPDADASLDPRVCLDARDLTFKQLAHKWHISMEELGLLLYDHCRNLSTFEEDRANE
jgi:hypothetical protein